MADGFEGQVAARLPLAEAAYESLRFLTDGEFLAGVYARHRGRSFEMALSFAAVVGLVGDALLEHAGSARRALRRARREADLPVTPEAFYAKLRRLPPALSHGFLAEAAARLAPLMPPAGAAPPLPGCLRDFEVLAVDGKKIKHAARRLGPARAFRGSVLGGKVLVALDLATGLAVAMSSDLDGEANDPPLVPALLAQFPVPGGVPPRPRLYVMDRQFCDLKLPKLIAGRGEHFLIRHNRKASFTPDGAAPARAGADGRGRRVTDERGWLGRPQSKGRRLVRRVTLDRPGEEGVSVLTDLLDAEAFPAPDLLALYARRWGIERVFQQVTEVFHLRRLIASAPPGMIFQCALCLVLYDLLQVLRGHVAAARGLDRERVSTENLFYDVRRQLVAWNELLPRACTVRRFAHPPSAPALAGRLRRLLGPLWDDAWLKAPPKRHGPQPRDPPRAGGHTSVYRLIQKARHA